MTPNVQKAVTLYPERAADYKWFDVGQVAPDNLVNFSHATLSLLLKQPMPFFQCAIAGNDPDELVFSILVTKAAEDSEFKDALLLETAVLNPTTKHHAKHKGFWIHCDLDNDEGLSVSFCDANDYKDEKILSLSKISSVILGVLLETIHNGDAQYKMYSATPSNSNVKRMRQGKQPLFSWHTVLIEPTKQKFPYQGGTHATPRQHDVRGHWVARNGKRFWRKPHKRGDASLGVVFHDYKIKSNIMELTQ